MARESKKARDERERQERDRQESEWHKKEGIWARRVGQWWLVLTKSYKAYSKDLEWCASLRHGWHRSANLVSSSRPLGDVADVLIEDMRAAADAWLVEVTGDLMALRDKGAPQTDEVTP